MKTFYVVEFITDPTGCAYSVLSNYYFKSEEVARAFALDFVKTSSTFDTFEIHIIMPY